MAIFAEDQDSDLEREFEECCNDPHGCDVSFSKQREASGYANFGFNPDEATRLREEELARIAAELENEPLDYEPEDDEDDDLLDDDEWDDEDDDWDHDLDLDDDDYDRFDDSLSLDDDEDEDDEAF